MIFQSKIQNKLVSSFQYLMMYFTTIEHIEIMGENKT
jgi:hypothetical protein